MKTKQSIVIFCLTLLACTVFAQENLQASAENGTPPPERRRWIGFLGSYGTAMHIWSSTTYKGYHNWSTGMFMEWESVRRNIWSLDIDTVWSGEIRYSKLWGTIPLSYDQLTDEELEQQEAGKYRTTLDHHQLTILGIRRWIFRPDKDIRPYLELGFGVSFLDKTIITNGTIWNFDFIGGAGFDIDLNKKWTLFAACRAAHFSNGGQIYITNKDVIGPESINGVLGLRYEL